MLPEFGGIELLAIAALALIVIGPKDLPVMLRKLGKAVGKMRAMANEFRASFDELARQSELDELRKEIEAMRQAQTYDPTGLVPGVYGPQGEAAEAAAAAAYEPAPEPVAEAAPQAEAKPKKPRTAKTAAKPAGAKAAAKTSAKPAAAKPAARKPAPRKPKVAS